MGDKIMGFGRKGQGDDSMKLDCRAKVIDFLNHLAKAAPKKVKKEAIQFDFTPLSFWLGIDLANEFLSTLNEIRLELVPKHANDMFLVNAFWNELVSVVIANPRIHVENSQILTDLVDRFGDQWKQPLCEYQVIYSIDHLAIGRTPVILHGIEFFSPTDEALIERAVPKEEIVSWRKREGTFALAIASVEAASKNIAFEAGRDHVIRAINMLRVSALSGLSGRIRTDELIQFTLSNHSLVMPVAAEEQPRWAWSYQPAFRPLVDELGDAIRQGIEKLGLERLKDVPQDIRNGVLRSIYWISRSASHESDDHKIVDLCTALEILLLPEGRLIANKGTVIALRYNLLLRGFGLTPSAVKWMYDRRNDVVHGSPLPVVGRRDTWDLRAVCYKTVDRIICVAASQPNVMTLEGLIATVETEENLDTFVWQVGIGMDMGSFTDQLVKEARKKLKKLRPIGP